MGLGVAVLVDVGVIEGMSFCPVVARAVRVGQISGRRVGVLVSEGSGELVRRVNGVMVRVNTVVLDGKTTGLISVAYNVAVTVSKTGIPLGVEIDGGAC